MPRFALILIAFFCMSCTKNDTVVIQDPTDVPVILAEVSQRETAVHEAAHAVVVAATTGPSHVQSIVVRIACCGGGLSGEAGYTDVSMSLVGMTPGLLRGLIAGMLAGRAADIRFFGGPTAGSSGDVEKANIAAWFLVNESGLLAEERGGFLIFPKECAPNFVLKEVNRELVRADAHAKALVAANADLIQEVAEEIMRQPVQDGARTLPGDAFAAFLKQRTLVIAVAPPEPPSPEGAEEPK
jgi:ATP-dependent Zn protease